MRHLTSGLKPFLQSHKRLAIVSVVVFSVLLFGGLYGAWSFLGWQAYEQRTGQSLSNIHARLDQALKLEVKDGKMRSAKLTALEKTKTDVEQYKKDCQPGVLLAWQTSFEAAKKLKDKCDAVASSLAQLQSDLERIVAYLRDESLIAALLRPLDETANLDETKWQQVSDTWQQVREKTGEATVGNAFKPVHEVVKERLAAVATAWTGLLEAHDVKDKARFESATEGLMRAYGTFKATAEDTAGVYQSLEDALQKSYQFTFH